MTVLKLDHFWIMILVRDSYFCNLDMMGRRADISSRPELLHGTIDVVAPADYMLKKPSKASILFALDCSRASVQSGAFMAYVQTVKEFIQNPRVSSRYSRVGIVTFDNNVQFYDLRETLNEPQIMIMSDILEPFVPLNDGLFFDPIASKEIALSLLERLPKLFQETRILDSCLGSVVSACVEAMKITGGRLVLMTSSIPTIGVGALKQKETQSGPLPADKVDPILIPQGTFYKDIAKKCSASSISINIVSTPSSTIDLATLSDLCKFTSGYSCVYPKFAFDLHMKKLVEETVCILLRNSAYDCVAKIRCGSGLQNDLNFGHFTVTEAGDLKFSCLDSEQTFATTFVYDSKLPENEKISFQLAVLYSTADGQARIRIHNVALPCAMDIGSVFKMADLDALINLQTKQIAGQFQDHPSAFLSTQVTSKCAHILAAYRKHCASNMSAGQLVLPDALKLLPLYSSCLLKQPTFVTSTLTDSRISGADQMVDLSMDCLPVLLYPRLFSLHNIMDSDQKRYYPPCVRLSHEYIEPHGIYLLENTQKLVIWIGQQVDPQLLSQIFGVSQLNAVNVNINVLPDLKNEISSKVRTLIQKLQHQRSQYLSLNIIRNGIDPWEYEWGHLLAEEGHSSHPSYVDYLCRVHGQIQQELSATPSLSERAAMLNFLH